MVVGRQRKGDQRADPQDRPDGRSRPARQVDASVVGSELIAGAGLQLLGVRWTGRRAGKPNTPDVAVGEHRLGSRRQQRVAGRQQERTVLPGDLGIGRDGHVLRLLVPVLQVLRQQHQGGIADSLVNTALGTHVLQPEVQARICDGHDS